MAFEQPTHNPIGTPDELRAAGLDLELHASCGPRIVGQQRGCPFWKSCAHDRKQLGGFKGQGPRNFAVYIKPAPGEGDPIECATTCYYFVHTLQNRMFEGLNRRNRGLPHEVIVPIAFEGDGKTYLRRIWEPNALDGGNKSKDYSLKFHDEEVEVAPFVRLGQNAGVTMRQKLDQRQAERERLAEEMSNAFAERAAAPASAEPEPIDFDLSDPVPVAVAPADPTVPVAAPSKGKRG